MPINRPIEEISALRENGFDDLGTTEFYEMN
jgi:hypothetical protein